MLRLTYILYSTQGMCVVRPDDSAGQGHIVACCGSGGAGNLRVFRDGIDVIGAAITVPMSLVINMWVITSPHGHMIIISTKNTACTFIVAKDGSNPIASANPKGFDESASTFCCCDLGNAAVQVTSKVAFLFNHGSGDCAWRPRFGRITSAEGNNGENLVISLSDGGIANISVLRCCAQTDPCRCC